MKLLLIFLSSLLLISNVNSGLTEEQRKAILKKVTKFVSFHDRNQPLNQVYNRDDSYKMTYEASKIKEIIDKYSFPETYNFIEAESPTVNIKDQANCGGCWAFASTTALAYRLKKKGVDVDLSPQHGISCYLRDCDTGDYLINSQFNLVKNGTVTEQCLPYSSSDGSTIEACPTKCKNGDDIVKYYAKNAYTTEEDYSQENYYDIVTAIIDQLITKGPVESGIRVYSDFYSLRNNANCKNIIYSYDGKSESVGGHAVVIVGYGVENNKYYWICQNSWGEDFCDGGFFKVEFGQINIEVVSFAEAFVDDNSEGKQIAINVNEVTGECKLKFSASEDMNGSFEVYYENENDFYFQCGPIYPDTKEGVCSYDAATIYNEKGTYKYREHSSLLNKDTYTLAFSSSTNQFNYYGTDYIECIFVNGTNYYVSQEANKITLNLYSPYSESTPYTGKIYPNKDSSTALSNCKSITLDSYYSVIHCTLSSSEIQSFSETNTVPLSYDILCGAREEMAATVKRFNSNRYPIFRVTEFLVPDAQIINYDSVFFVVADIEGSLSGFNSKEFYFSTYVRIESGNRDSYELLICGDSSPTELDSDYEIPCYLDIYSYTSYSFNNIYLTPYIVPVEGDPFQVIIEREIEGDEYDDDDFKRYTSSSHYISIQLSLIILLVICLF
jgi:cathepsin B